MPLSKQPLQQPTRSSRVQQQQQQVLVAGPVLVWCQA
jgi:hypothetical protein